MRSSSGNQSSVRKESTGAQLIVNSVGTRLHEYHHARYGMSVPAWRVMAHLGELQPLSAKEIARRAAMDSVSVSRALNQLESLGLLNRKTDGDDRRREVLRWR